MYWKSESTCVSPWAQTWACKDYLVPVLNDSWGMKVEISTFYFASNACAQSSKLARVSYLTALKTWPGFSGGTTRAPLPWTKWSLTLKKANAYFGYQMYNMRWIKLKANFTQFSPLSYCFLVNVHGPRVTKLLCTKQRFYPRGSWWCTWPRTLHLPFYGFALI